MEIGGSDRRKLEEQAPRLPITTTPLKPIVPRPVPIWTAGMENQLCSHSNGIPAGFDPSACPEIINWPNHRSEPAPLAHHNAETGVQISFDGFPSSSNGIAELFTQADTPLAYSNVTNEELLSQFIPPYNSQFNPTYTSFDHHQLSLEQPFLNTIYNQYQDLPGSSYSDYCSKTFPQIAPHQDDVIAAETRKDAAAPTTIEESNQAGEEKNAPATKRYIPHSKPYNPTTEVAAVSAPRKENYNHKMVDFDLNKTPQPKPGRRKHRPKVIKEDKPKKTTKKVTAESVQSKENPTDKRKPRRKGLNTTSTPRTEVTGEGTKPLTPESATCRRSLNFETREQPSSNNSNSRDCLSKGCGLQAVGSKRKQPGIEQADNLIGAQYNAMQAYCLNYGVQFPNVQKKRRSENGRISKTPRKSSVTATKDVQLATFLQDARSHSYVSSPNFWTSDSEYKAAGFPVLITATERAIHDKHQPLEYTLTLGQKRPTKRRSRASTRSHAGPEHTTKQTCSSDRRTFGDAERPQTCIDALVADLRASVTKKKRTTKRRIPVGSSYSCKNERQHNTLDKWKDIEMVDALTEQFRFLNIDRETQEHELHGQNILVPYVPFDPRKLRPKVDLDEETSKVWCLLLADINSSGIDGTDPDKAKWWEEERKVFRGRADSFIARMHQVQGDRRFSMWKGSVVDSVVGVFLTQNVSDHLSSSAFMSLAARFPLKSTSTCQKESTSSMANEPQVCIVEPEETGNQGRKILVQSAGKMNCKTIDIIENPEEREGVDSNVSCRTNGSLICVTGESNDKMLESAQRCNSEHSPVESGTISAMTEEVQESLCYGSVRKELNNEFPSQTSGGFSNDQNPEKMGSFSDSNSEIEDLSSTAQFNIYYNRTSFRELLAMASSTTLHEVNSQRSKSTENFRDTSIDLNHDNQVGNLEKSHVTLTQDTFETPITKEYTTEVTPNSGVLEVNCYDPLKIEVPSSDSSKDNDEKDKRHSFPTESNSQAAFVDSHGMISQLHPLQQTNHEQHNVFHISGQNQDPAQKERDQKFGDPNYEMRKKNSKKESDPVKRRSKKSREEKKNNFDWDSLRIQAQARAGKREKTENTMDSVDWDAVRRADVSEISETIKERGMNNMLAKRIQDFLNLLVDKHEGIDLEWLRDVPPDQAKEFLLSINGLGLKSVECVRLLTLHHLAFPVDTNVGRIAVRLGWVPLQPLPESLQLHLLELYPVLESVQKYLWPRLCKLDQRTLYELHYQLITFGKVFCTKSKPNCNACPMRGECRHFASAFASARLALPAPEEKGIEEKGIVTTSGNNANEQNPPPVINQWPLLLPENTIQDEHQQNKMIIQPFVEMPASPEPELSENDIEDAFNEEPCLIPNIELDIEEFTLNLKNYVQQNMELQEREMSKALVALHPDAARIPTPKLKNVSKLRTEHYVYELPDSHPLLNGWEQREPDDPGKYLLAIWTPGETADSMQPPERKCSSQECGQLCKENECFACNSLREANSQIVRGTILIPCRTAMRGSFPLNGTYFQVNEVFADNDSSLNPISVPRSWIWNLDRRTVYFGTSVPYIFKGLSTQEIQQCFWRGYVCVRGFDRKTRAPRPLLARLHFPASKTPKKKDNAKKNSKPAK